MTEHVQLMLTYQEANDLLELLNKQQVKFYHVYSRLKAMLSYMTAAPSDPKSLSGTVNGDRAK